MKLPKIKIPRFKTKTEQKIRRVLELLSASFSIGLLIHSVITLSFTELAISLFILSSSVSKLFEDLPRIGSMPGRVSFWPK